MTDTDRTVHYKFLLGRRTQCGLSRVAPFALFAAAAALMTVYTTGAQTPEPTPSVPAANLRAPGDLVVLSDGVRWRDDSVGEDGYRVVASLGTDTRTFDLPADATAVTMPGDFRAVCNPPERSTLSVRVFAFKGAQEGASATGRSTMLCAPAATATTSVPASLPGTGSGSGDDNSLARRWALVAAGVAFASGVAIQLVRRSLGRNR